MFNVRLSFLNFLFSLNKGISLEDHVGNVKIRRTQIDDVIARIARMK